MYLWIKKGKGDVKYYYMCERRIENGKPKNVILESLGREDKLALKHSDPEAWARKYVAEKSGKNAVAHGAWNLEEEVPEGKQLVFNGGYLFLQRIYCDLHMPEICAALARMTHPNFNINNLLSRLIYSRVIFAGLDDPVIKDADRLLQKRDFTQENVVPAIELLAEKCTWIERQIRNRLITRLSDTNSLLLCACHKVTWPMPGIMGDVQNHDNSRTIHFVMDQWGVPLLFWIGEEDTAEVVHENFDPKHVIACAGPGNAPDISRGAFDGFVRTEAFCHLDRETQDWARGATGWRKLGEQCADMFTLRLIQARATKKDQEIYYKERRVSDDSSVSRRLIVTYSPSSWVRSCTDSDPLDGDSWTNWDNCGGFGAVWTDTAYPPEEVLRIARFIDEAVEIFRILPRELSDLTRTVAPGKLIAAHSLTSFISLLHIRLLEMELRKRDYIDFTFTSLRDELSALNYVLAGEVYFPAFMHTPLTDALEHTFSLPIHRKAYTTKGIRQLCRLSRGRD